MNNWIVDTHCHIYDNYSVSNWLTSLFNNFKFQQNYTYAVFLTERFSENYYFTLSKFQEFDGFIINKSQDENGFEFTNITNNSNNTVRIYPGRQYKSTEGLEVLGVSGKEELKDFRGSILEILNLLHANQSISIIPWSLGKWNAKKTKELQTVLSQINFPVYLGNIIGYTKLLDGGFSKIQNDFGLDIILGSDPLPIKNEEKYLGLNYSVIQTKNELIHSLLNRNFQSINNFDHKISLLQSFSRQMKLRLQ
jgi:hypothetical protein